MSLIITRGGCQIAKKDVPALFTAAQYKKITGEYIITIPKSVGMPERVVLFKNMGDYFVYPRRILLHCNSYVNKLPLGKKIDHKMDFVLSGNQEAVMAKLKGIYTPERMESGRACALLDMPAGHGKTILAGAVITHCGLQAVYIVHRKPLAEQTMDEFRKIGLNVAIWPKISDITIVIVNTAITIKSDDFWNNIGCVVIDEVHAYTSEKRKDVFRNCMARCMLGMSGTLCDRNDKPEGVYLHELCLDEELAPIVAKKLPDWEEDETKFDCVVKAIKYYGPNEFTQNITSEATGKLFTPYMIKQFLADKQRNQIIVNETKRLLETHKGVYVFCHERDALVHFAELLSDLDPNIPEISTVLVGKSSKPDINTARNKSQLILTTYAYSSTGTSITRMTAMVLATPMRSGLEQVSKRIMRKGSDPSIVREIVDIIDASTAMAGQFSKRGRINKVNRMDVYKANAFTVNYVTIDCSGKTDDES